MSILSLHNVSQSFGAFDLFSGISASIPNDGKIGLVGPNGVGKTTLLNIIVGRSAPKAGEVHIAKRAKVGFLRQEALEAFAGREASSVYAEMLRVFAGVRELAAELRELEGRMAAEEHSDALLEEYSHKLEEFERRGGYDYELRIEQTLDGLGFDRENWETPLMHLSGGQRTRALLARLLLERPTLLVLDEPTNHLDVAAIEWLENTLKNWEGAVLIVSHDRYFLDKVVDTIWEMSATQIEVYRGGYSAYVQQRAERWERREKEYAALRERMEKEIDYIKRNMAGQRTQMAQGKLARLTRDLVAIEVGGIALLNSGKGWLEMGVGSQRSFSVAEAEERVRNLPRPVYRPRMPNLRLAASHRSGNIVLRTAGMTVGYPGAPLFETDEIVLLRQECAALIGPNGSGKTTFLKTALGELEPLAGAVQLGASLKLGYFSQAHDSLNLENTILDELLRHKQMLLSEARSYLGQYLFSGDDVFKQVGTLSGGERGRLALAILALQNANFLLLDEPTNHLDIAAQELLEEVLQQFDGTILMVSHDRYLINQLATQIWVVENGRLEVFQGNYGEYVAARAAQSERPVTASLEQTAEISANGRENGANRPQLSKNELRRREEAVATLENEIAATEAAVAQAAEALQEASAAQDFDKIQSISLEYAELEAHLDTLIKQWEKLASE